MNPSNLTHIIPFDDSSIELDGLTIESAADRIALYGSLDILKDEMGLEKARNLVQYLNKTIISLETSLKEGTLSKKITLEKPIIKDNPMG